MPISDSDSGGSGLVVQGTGLTVASVSIAGGKFQGGNAVIPPPDAGSVAGSGLVVGGNSNVSISGGNVLGGGVAGIATALNVNIYRYNPPTVVNITGGQFVGGSVGTGLGYSLFDSSEGDSTVSVSGGQFTGNMAIQLWGPSSLSFSGSGFEYNGSTGLLTGTLSDGSLLDVITNTNFHDFPVITCDGSGTRSINFRSSYASGYAGAFQS